MHWSKSPIHYIDFEGSPGSGVVEYGVATLLAGKITSVRTRMCGAAAPITAIDLSVHGLSDATLEGAALMKDDWEFFTGIRQTGPFAAHFAGTENAMLRNVWPYARQSPDFAKRGATTNEWGPWIDTGQLVRQLYRGLISARLEDLIDSFKLRPQLEAETEKHCPPDRRFFHAALFDAIAGALLLQAMLNQPHFAGVTVRWLLQQSTLEPFKRGGLQQSQMQFPGQTL